MCERFPNLSGQQSRINLAPIEVFSHPASDRFLARCAAAFARLPHTAMLHQRRVWFLRYCQLKPDLADWTCGAHSVIPDESMDYLEANCVLRVEFSLS